MEIACSAFDAKFNRSTAFVVEGQVDHALLDISLKHLHSIFKWYGLVHHSTQLLVIDQEAKKASAADIWSSVSFGTTATIDEIETLPFNAAKHYCT